MKKLIACSLLSLCMVFASVSSTLAAADPGPADITVGEGGKKPAKFPHKAHQAFSTCGDCHHGMDAAGKQLAYSDGQEIKKCASCHNEKVLAGKVKGAHKLDTMKGAGHGNCQECHKAKKNDEAYKAKKIDKCDTCHAKE